MGNEIYSLVRSMNEESVYALVKDRIDNGSCPYDVMEACREAMFMAVKSYETRETYLDSMLDAARILNKAESICGAHISEGEIKYNGKVIVCTVENDVHQNGRLMAGSVLRACGFDVNDLGGEVPPAKIVEAVKAEPEAVLALSGLVSSCIDSMKITLQAVRNAGLSPVSIVAGGLACEYLRRYADADYYARDIPDTVHICEKHCIK